MQISRIVKVWLFLTAFLLWCVTAVLFAPPSFAYSAAFALVCFIVLVATYRFPLSGWWLFAALTPVIGLPSRALALGAHQALIFLTYAFLIGWLANKLVTKEKIALDSKIAIPLFFIVFIGVASGIATILRFSNFFPIFTGAFKNGWVNAAGVVASKAILHSVLSTLKLLIFPALFIASYDIWSENCKNKSQLKLMFKKLLTIWSVMLIPVIITALYQNLFNPEFCMLNEPAWQEAKRVSGGMSDPNSLGLFLFLILPATASFVIFEKGIKQILFGFITVAGLYVITLTGSRSALLGIILVVFLAFAFSFLSAFFNKKSRKKIILIAGAVLIVLLAGTFFVSSAGNRAAPSDNPLLVRLQKYTQRLSLKKSERIVDRREWQWKQAIAMWKDYPFTGIGVGAFPIEVANYNLKTMTETPVDNAWNQYLHWLSETGIAGVFFWAWFYFAFISVVYKGIKKEKNAALTPQVIAVASSIIVLQLLFIFGAHLQAAEVSVAAAVFSSFLLINFYSEKAKNKTKRIDIIILIITASVIFINLFHNSLTDLSYDSVQKRYNLPYDFGFYRGEKWAGQFDYKWSQKFAGKKITVPKDMKIILLKIAAINPKTSAENPLNIVVKIDGEYLDTLKIDNPDWHTYQIFIYKKYEKPAVLSFETDKIWQPPNENPPRKLGFALADNIIFTNCFKREAQGLSDWKKEISDGKNIDFRWTGKRAALNLFIRKNAKLKIKLRAPASLKFYQKPIKVTLKINDNIIDTYTLPDSDAEWLTQTINVNKNLCDKNALLTFEVSRMSDIRVKNSVKRIKVGAALAIEQ